MVFFSCILLVTFGTMGRPLHTVQILIDHYDRS